VFSPQRTFQHLEQIILILFETEQSLCLCNLHVSNHTVEDSPGPMYDMNKFKARVHIDSIPPFIAQVKMGWN
jgi:hypothetical protein